MDRIYLGLIVGTFLAMALFLGMLAVLMFFDRKLYRAAKKSKKKNKRTKELATS